MAVHTDNPRFAAAFLPHGVAKELAPRAGFDPDLEPTLEGIFGGAETLFSAEAPELPWPYLSLAESSVGSQYDQVIQMIRDGIPIPDRFACLAGSGSGFHGFKGRAWSAVPGNLHLVVHFAPSRPIDRFEVAFTILAALSVVDALAQIDGLHSNSRIKWINDVVLGDAKVGGILAYTQSQGHRVSAAVLGIGLNVETVPEVEPTPFVPSVTSVREFAAGSRAELRAEVLTALLGALEKNYRTLLEEGLSPLLERYRNHSMVIGKEVSVHPDTADDASETIVKGRVAAIGDHLELILADRSEPVTGGRLALHQVTGDVRIGAPGAHEVDVAPAGAKSFC